MANSHVLERRIVIALCFSAASDILSRTLVSDTWSRTSLDSHVLGQKLRYVTEVPVLDPLSRTHGLGHTSFHPHFMCRSQAGPDHCIATGGNHPGQPYCWPTTKLLWDAGVLMACHRSSAATGEGLPYGMSHVFSWPRTLGLGLTPRRLSVGHRPLLSRGRETT